MSGPQAIALDTAAKKMYWTDWETAKIQRANLDGSGDEDLVVTRLARPIGLALDVPDGKMYWVDFGVEVLQRANLDGSGMRLLPYLATSD